MKSWVVQRNNYDNGVAVVKNLIEQLGVKITHTTIEKNLYASEQYPSLAALEEKLKELDFETMAANIPVSKLPEVIPPAIAFLEQSREFVLIISHKDMEVTYIHPRIGWITESAESFMEKWEGVVLMADPGENSEEVDYPEKVKQERIKKENDPRCHKIKIIDDFISNTDCRRLIDISEKLYRRSATVKNGKAIIDEHRTSFTAVFERRDDVVERVYQLATEVLDQPKSHFEFLQCTSYSRGQEYKAHYDTLEESNSEIAKRGQRASTMLIYLNDDYQGGETYFPELDVRIQPRTGRALLFHNLDDDGHRDPCSCHAGLPVWSGKKYVSNLWVRNKPTGSFTRFQE